jgi:flagellar protein FlaF
MVVANGFSWFLGSVGSKIHRGAQKTAARHAETLSGNPTFMSNTYQSEYRVLGREGLSHSDLGAEVLNCAALGIRKALRHYRTQRDDATLEALMEALRRNQRLWTILQVECGSPECGLGDEVRVNFLQLSRYVDSMTFQCIAAPEVASAEGLARINENLAEGFSMAAQASRQASQPSPELAVSLSF